MSKKIYTCGIDIGSEEHEVALHNSEGEEILNKKIVHSFSSFNEIILEFKEIEKKSNIKIEIGLEGKNGYGKPLDRLLLENGFTLYNVDSTKLRKFREVYGADNKTDERDASMIAILLRNRPLLENSKEKPFEEMKCGPIINEKLRLLSRHQQTIIEERIRLSNSLIQKLLCFCPGLLKLGSLKGLRVLGFLKKYPDPSKYNKLTIEKLMKINQIGIAKAKEIKELIKNIEYDKVLAKEYAYIIKSKASRIMELVNEENEVEKQLEQVGDKSEDVKILRSLDGAGTKNASRLIGEISNINNFSKESKLAAYFGVICVNNNSGKKKSSKKNRKCNRICKKVMLNIAGNSIRLNNESREYYKKKRTEYGYNKKGSHIHALRCLARQLTKVIYKMLTEKRKYFINEDYEEAA